MFFLCCAAKDGDSEIVTSPETIVAADEVARDKDLLRDAFAGLPKSMLVGGLVESAGGVTRGDYIVEFVIDEKRTELGIELNRKTLTVMSIRPGGLAARYNRDASDLFTITVGDKVVAVNEFSGDGLLKVIRNNFRQAPTGTIVAFKFQKLSSAN
eukprot:TRINITY_DN60932_c0_g1_i1.p1 TRINITY_DN60932_c0_g1~~TRINITY_DN60932_c0_g1_i1.p1  ORF type:complete len:155 (+),score=17.62 TRINITY_DN60932_c0_g1_i1:49-513(+)